MRKALHDRLARLVIVNGEVRDRLQIIAEMPAAMQALLNDVQVWLTCDDTGQRKNAAEALHQRSAQLAQRLAAQALTFEDALRVNFLRYIAELIILLQQCERLSEAIHHASLRQRRRKIVRRQDTFSIAIPQRRPHGAGRFCHHSERLSAMDLLCTARWRHGGVNSWCLLHAVWQFRHAGPAYCEIYYRLCLGRSDKPYL